MAAKPQPGDFIPGGITVGPPSGSVRGDWLRWRREGLGASDAAAVVGMSRWSSPYTVWLDKTGALPIDATMTQAQSWGLRLEQPIAEAFEEEKGTQVTGRGAWVESREYPWLRATLDGLAILDGKWVVVEIKTSNGRDHAWDEGVPDYYEVQVQHQLAVTGLEVAHLAVLLGGSDYRSYEIPRDDEAIAKLIELESQFWTGNVLANVEPGVDGSPATAGALKIVYASADPDTEVELDKDMAEWLELLREAKARVKDAEAEVTLATNEIMAALGTHEVGTLNGRPVISWKQQTAARLDTERLRADHPELAAQYVKESTYRVLRAINRRTDDDSGY